MGKIEKIKKVRKGFFSGFKDFVTKGNVIDLAVGVIIGGAFGKIVTSLVNDIIMPPIGYLIGDSDFKDLSIILKSATENTPEIAIHYGNFIMTIIEFLIIAFSIYFVLTLIIRRKAFQEKLLKEEAERLAALEEKEAVVEVVEKVIPEEILLLREIRDSLNKKDSNW